MKRTISSRSNSKLSSNIGNNGSTPNTEEEIRNLKRKKRNMKKLKQISPSAIKNLNYNNTKQDTSIIEKYLPPKKVVWLLIDRFFERIYLHLPFIDEESFRIQIGRIIDSSDRSSQKIRLASIGTQYCEKFLNICLLLIVLRLSWLSLPSSHNLKNLTPDEILMMKPENTITLVLVDMVKEIFSSTKILSKPSLIIFQVGLYLKYYNILSPEDGFDLDDSYTSSNSSYILSTNDLNGDLTNESPNINSPSFLSVLIQLAKTIGLNRDPLNFKNFYSTTEDPIMVARLFKKRHLWRKLWYSLLFISIEGNLSLGDYNKGLPIEIDVDPTYGLSNSTWDCRLPGGVEQGTQLEFTTFCTKV
ncbi:unnamed protein product [[Candida] boidinii]|nr:unnamed protein product [[Candida] boidinii]